MKMKSFEAGHLNSTAGEEGEGKVLCLTRALRGPQFGELQKSTFTSTERREAAGKAGERLLVQDVLDTSHMRSHIIFTISQ